jgi:hypothetical protein
MSDGAGGFSPRVAIKDNRGAPKIADMDGDGHEDLVSMYGLAASLPWGVFILYGDGAGSFVEGAPWKPRAWDDVNNHVHFVAIGDVNGDGKPDIVVAYGRAARKQQSGALDGVVDIFVNTTSREFVPVMQRPFLVSGMVGEPFRYRIYATGTKPIAFSASPLPAGLSLNGDTISGRPTKAGKTKVTLRATNGAGSDTRPLWVTVADGRTGGRALRRP